MANKCDRCGVAKADYKRQGIDSMGNMCECSLCENCYQETSSKGWTSTKNGGVITWQKTKGQCAFCGAVGEVSDVSYKNTQGATQIYPACDSCKRKIYGNSEVTRIRESDDQNKTNWTKFLRSISKAFVLLSTVFGGIFLYAIVGMLDGEAFLGLLGGAVIGFLIGIVTVSFTMVICEISETLKSNNTELKKIYIELTRR